MVSSSTDLQSLETALNLVPKESPSLPCCMYHYKGDLSTSANHQVSWDAGNDPGPYCNVGCEISLKIRRVRQHRPWLKKGQCKDAAFHTLVIYLLRMLPALQAQPSAVLSFTPADTKGCFQVYLCVH